MAVLKEIFMVMLYILGIVALFVLIISILNTFIVERKKDKAVDDFANKLLSELEKELAEKESKPKKTTKKRNTTKKSVKKEEN